MRSTQTLAALALASAATANVIPDIITEVECLVVSVVVNVLRANPEAIPYCSSILHIPTVTVSKPTTLVLPTTLTDVITTTITPTVTATSTVVETTSVCAADPEKRDVAPRSPPDWLTPYPTSDVPRACSCLHLPTPSTTVTPTVTLTPTFRVTAIARETAAPVTTVETCTSTSTIHACPAPTACGNQGIAWEYLTSTSGDNEDDSYSSFVPEEYKGRTPVATGVTNTIGGIDTPGGETQPIYGSSQNLSTDYFVLNHRGYIYAQQTGTYTFSISGVDDALYIWIGPNAYSGWTQANANSKTMYNISDGEPGVGSFSINLNEGQYYPLRMIFAQGGGPAVFALQVTAPDGTIFLGANTAASPYLVQFSCDGTTAPAYPAWTAEH